MKGSSAQPLSLRTFKTRRALSVHTVFGFFELFASFVGSGVTKKNFDPHFFPRPLPILNQESESGNQLMKETPATWSHPPSSWHQAVWVRERHRSHPPHHRSASCIFSHALFFLASMRVQFKIAQYFSFWIRVQ